MQILLPGVVVFVFTKFQLDVKVLKSLVKTKTTTPGNNIYTLLITFIAFTSFNSSKFQTLFSHTNSHITLGPPVIYPVDSAIQLFNNRGQ